jgi:hypothetical protein
MPNQSPVPLDILDRYEVHEWRHGLTILFAAHSEEWRDILETLRGFRLLRSDLLKAGGRKSDIAEKIDGALLARGWKEKSFNTRIVVDETEYVTPTHKVDCYRNRVALEVEWRNKDPFFDRDLNNFRLLFELRAIDVGVIITRCTDLEEIAAQLGRKLGTSTTHLAKLLPRVDGGGGGGCPIVVFGIRKENYFDDSGQ